MLAGHAQCEWQPLIQEGPPRIQADRQQDRPQQPPGGPGLTPDPLLALHQQHQDHEGSDQHSRRLQVGPGGQQRQQAPGRPCLAAAQSDKAQKQDSGQQRQQLGGGRAHHRVEGGQRQPPRQHRGRRVLDRRPPDDEVEHSAHRGAEESSHQLKSYHASPPVELGEQEVGQPGAEVQLGGGSGHEGAVGTEPLSLDELPVGDLEEGGSGGGEMQACRRPTQDQHHAGHRPPPPPGGGSRHRARPPHGAGLPRAPPA